MQNTSEYTFDMNCRVVDRKTSIVEVQLLFSYNIQLNLLLLIVKEDFHTFNIENFTNQLRKKVFPNIKLHKC